MAMARLATSAHVGRSSRHSANSLPAQIAVAPDSSGLLISRSQSVPMKVARGSLPLQQYKSRRRPRVLRRRGKPVELATRSFDSLDTWDVLQPAVLPPLSFKE